MTIAPRRSTPIAMPRTGARRLVQDRITEEGGGPAITRDGADGPEPRGEVQEIQRARAERPAIAPTPLLGGGEPDVERSVVARDPPVTTSRDPCDVADHLLLEEA